MALKNWSTTAGSNATVDSINWAENQAPSTVNDSARALMSDVRTWYNDLEWRDWGHTVTQTSATTFTVATDVTAIYVVDQPIRCTDSSTLYGKVTARSYSAPNTTVTVSLDSGSLSASLTAVSLGQKPTGKPIDVTGVRGAVANTGTETIAGDKTFTGNNTHSGTQTISGTVTMSGKSLWTAEGAAVASAADCNIWTTDGNTVHVTGTTTIAGWGTAPQAGATKMVIFDGALQLTYGATTNKLNTGGSNYTTTAGDRAMVYAESTTSYLVTIFPFSGSPLSAPTAAQGASMVLLSTQTASASAQIDFTSANGIGSTYDQYEVYVEHMLPSANVSLLCRLDTNDGASFDAGATDYRYISYVIDDAGVSTNDVSAGATSLKTNGATRAISSNTGGGGWSGFWKFSGFNSTTSNKTVQWDGNFFSDAATLVNVKGGGMTNSATLQTAAVNAIRFFLASGTITSGKFHLYGIKKA